MYIPLAFVDGIYIGHYVRIFFFLGKVQFYECICIKIVYVIAKKKTSF